MDNIQTNNSGKIVFASSSIGFIDDIGISYNSQALYNNIINSDIIAVENLFLFNALCEKANVIPQGKVIQYNHLSENNEETSYLIDEAKNGKIVLIVSDGGTAALYDPGLFLLNLAINESIEIDVMPGPNSAIPAILMSGFFLGRGFISLGWVFMYLKENNMFVSLDSWFNQMFNNSPLPISMLYTSDIENLVPQSNVEKLKKGIAFFENNIDKNKRIFFISNMSTNYEYKFRGSFGEFLQAVKDTPQNFVNGILVLESAY